MPGSEFCVLTAAPEWTAERYGVESVPKTGMRAVARAIRKSDVVVSPGGGIFQDSTSARSVIYYIMLLMIARIYRKPVFLLSQGMGPLGRKWVRKLTRRSLDRNTRHVWVRDEPALEFTHELGLEGPHFSLGADMVFALMNGEICPEREPEPGGPLRVAVSLRPCDGLDRVAGALEGCLLRLCKERPVELHLFAFDREEDVAAVNRFAEEMRRSTPDLDVRIFGASRIKPLEIPEVLEAIAGMDVVVGMRLHSLVFASLCGTPFVALCYDPKVRAFAEACGQPFIVDPTTASALELDAAITRLIGEGRAAARAALAGNTGRLSGLLKDSLESFANELSLIEEARLEVLGIPVSGLSLSRTLEKIFRTVRESGKLHIVTVNPEMALRADGDPEFRELLRSGTLNTPDGVGIRIGVRLKYKRRIEAVTGVDMAEALLSKSKELGLRIFLLGGKPEVIEKCVAKAASLPEAPIIAGHHHGYLDGIDPEALRKTINDAAPDIVLAGMGSPLQEYWIRDNKGKLGASVFIGVGGTFDVLAGEAKRAPAVFRKIGMEWAYRLITNPSRLRRVAGFPIFFIRIVFDAFRGHRV